MTITYNAPATSHLQCFNSIKGKMEFDKTLEIEVFEISGGNVTTT